MTFHFLLVRNWHTFPVKDLARGEPARLPGRGGLSCNTQLPAAAA